MSIDNVINRRTALVAGLAGASALTLAACGSSSGGSGGSDRNAAESGAANAGSTSPSTAASSSDAATPAGSSPATSTPASSAPAGSSGAAKGTQLAKLTDITVGQAISTKLDGKPVVVARPTATTAVCFSAICTHQGCTVAPAGKSLDCPCHGSSFNATTGAVLGGPAPSPLPKVEVTVTDGVVYAT